MRHFNGVTKGKSKNFQNKIRTSKNSLTERIICKSSYISAASST